MNIQGAHNREAKEAVFIAVQSGQTAAITKGSLCAWDTTDNSAQAGILANTRGLRVIVYPAAEGAFVSGGAAVTDGLARQAGIAHSDMEAFASVASATSGQTYLLQVYGFRDDVIVNTSTNGNILAGGLIVSCADQAGAVDGLQTETTPTVHELYKTVGISLQTVAAAGSASTMQAFIKCL